MAKIEDAMKIISWLEHSNDNERVLHKNKGELGLTFFGIYQSAHPTLSIWNTINKALKIEPNIKKLPQDISENISLISLDNRGLANIHLILVDHVQFKNIKWEEEFILDTKGLYN